MGNRLSGRFGYRSGQKAFTTDLPYLDIRDWVYGRKTRTGSFCMALGDGHRVYLDVQPNRIIVRASAVVLGRLVQAIPIEYTGSRASRRRAWVCCPNPSCGRRVIALYFQNGFFCRHCLNLAYPSQSLSRIQRLCAEYGRLEERIGLVEGEPVRPKGMHRRTYEPLAARARLLHSCIFGPVERSMARVRELDLAAAKARGQRLGSHHTLR